jgi:hypothetical protein
VTKYGVVVAAAQRTADAADGAYAHGIDLADASPVSGPITVAGWAELVDVATITEPEHVEALESKLIWTGDYVVSRFMWKSRDPLWVLLRRVHRLDEPITIGWRDECGGCTSCVDYEGMPADPATMPSQVVISDVAFAAKRKGIRDALPDKCWRATR